MSGATPIQGGGRAARWLPLALAALLPAAPPAPAAEEVLDLPRLLRIAADTHPDLAIARARVEAARGRTVQAGLRLNPVVSVGADELNSPDNAAGSQRVNLLQTVQTANKRLLAQAAAAQGVVVADWQAVTQWYVVATRVQAAYYEVLTAYRDVQTNEAVVRLTEQALRAAEALEKAGAGTRPDVLRARVQRDEAAARLGVSRRRLQAAGRLLAAAVGLPHLPDAPLAGGLDAEVPGYEWPALAEAVLARSSEVQEALALERQAEQQLRLAVAERTPNVTLQLQPYYDFPDQSFEMQVQVGGPLPVFNRNQGNIAAARAEVARSAAQVRQVELRLAERLAPAYQRYQAAREQREAFERRILPGARESLRLVTLGYERGDPRYDFTALQQAQQTLVQAQLAHVQVLGELWRAVSDIRGLLQEDVLPPFGARGPADGGEH